MCKRLKKISQSALRRKVIKNIKPLQEKSVCLHKITDTLKIFAS